MSYTSSALLNFGRIFLSVFFIFSGLTALNAQAPSWTVDASKFQHTMTVVAFLSADGVTLEDPQDKIGAFVGNEVRGAASPVFSASADRHLAFLTIYGNLEGEVISFKIYDHSASKTVTVSKTMVFSIDGQSGNVFQAFSAANPVLNNIAEVEQFGFTDITPVTAEETSEGIDIVLEYDQDLSALTPEFTLSTGATLFMDRTKINSADAPMDFSEMIIFSVRSEDESVLREYKVTVSRRVASDDPFSCTNVLTANGDGKNDFWIVNESFRYRNHTFKIFDVNGRILFQSVGYNNDWDGLYKGKLLDRGQYYYSVLDPAGEAEVRGTILVMH
jgi:gliding motility-associated-like protein